MPTAMKNRPSSSPLNGSTAASISWRYSDSASSTPPRNAPSAIDSPACSKASAITSTRSRAKAVKISRRRVRAMWRNTGRATRRPPPSVSTITAAGERELLPGECVEPLAVPSSGSSASIGITAMSWNSSTAKVPWPPLRRERAALGQRRERERGGGKRQRHRRRSARRAARSRAPSPLTVIAAIEPSNLRKPEAEQLRAHVPQPLRLELQADHEEQEHHAELGERPDMVRRPRPAGSPTGRWRCRPGGSRPPTPGRGLCEIITAATAAAK